MVITVFDVVNGPYCTERITTEKIVGGETIRHLIIYHWVTEDKILVDFKNITVTTSAFMDEAFGKLLFYYSLDELKSKIDYDNITYYSYNKIEKVISLRMLNIVNVCIKRIEKKP